MYNVGFTLQLLLMIIINASTAKVARPVAKRLDADVSTLPKI